MNMDDGQPHEHVDDSAFLRVFIAIEITDEIRRNLAEVERELAGTGARVKWVRPEAMHLTLAFIGNTPVEEVDPIAKALDAAVVRTRPFSCRVAGIGFFGNPSRPRIIWAGMRGSLKSLIDLQAGVAASLKDAGVEFDDKPFKPHLTIGRVRSPRNLDGLMRAMKRYEESVMGELPVTRVLLIRSELKPEGARYTALHKSELSSN